MRGLRSTIALVVVLAGLGAYVYFVTWKLPEGGADASATKKEKVFAGLDAAKIEEVKVSTAAGESTTAKKEAGGWQLTAPLAAKADESELSSITSALTSADMVRVVDENPTDLNAYGLLTPRIEVDFKATGDKDYKKLLVGEKTPTGADMYARRNDEKKVFLIPAMHETSLNRTTFDLRDKVLLKVDREKLDGIEVTAGGKTLALAKDSVFWLSVFNTIFYTVSASIVKFAIGLYLALLLNERLPFKSMIRAIVLLPFVVPTVLSAIAFWWIYDSQFSIISWVLIKAGLITRYIDFLGDPWNARLSVVAANIWRGVPFVAITLLAGLQTISPSLYEAANLDGATNMQRFRHITLPMLSPIIAVVMTFSVLMTFTDFQLIYTITRGGPINATHLMATLSFQRAITGGNLGEGAAISNAMIPFLVAAILLSFFGLQRSRWQQGGRD